MRKSSSPSALGYRMPAEWEPHEATWLSWPHPGCQSFPGSYDRVVPTFVQMISALAESETVRINILDKEEERHVRGLLKNVPMERIEFHATPTNEPWCRDHGPIFLKREAPPRLAALHCGFNAWGYKLSPFDDDAEAGAAIARAGGAEVFDHTDFVLEGGSVDVNGSGVVLTTESCLLNANRNPKLDRGKIETHLRDLLGVQTVLWLGDGIEGDDTDGHVDDIARFVARDTVLAVTEDDENDPNFEPLRANLERLHLMQIPGCGPLRVLNLPMPSRIMREGLRLPASYANFYIANEVVLLPVFNDHKDSWAEAVLREVFPGRKIVPIDCRELIWGLGAFHCLTQQQPAV